MEWMKRGKIKRNKTDNENRQKICEICGNNTQEHKKKFCWHETDERKNYRKAQKLDDSNERMLREKRWMKRDRVRERKRRKKDKKHVFWFTLLSLLFVPILFVVFFRLCSWWIWVLRGWERGVLDVSVEGMLDDVFV